MMTKKNITPEDAADKKQKAEQRAKNIEDKRQERERIAAKEAEDLVLEHAKRRLNAPAILFHLQVRIHLMGCSGINVKSTVLHALNKNRHHYEDVKEPGLLVTFEDDDQEYLHLLSESWEINVITERLDKLEEVRNLEILERTLAKTAILKLSEEERIAVKKYGSIV